MKHLHILALFVALAACSNPDTSHGNESDIAAQADSLVSTFNRYQAVGDATGAVAWLDSLMQDPPEGLRHDIEVIYGYALSRIDSLESAEQHITHALSVPMEQPDDKRRFRDYAYAAATFFPDLGREDDVISWAQAGLECAARCGYPAGTDYLRAMLADIYKRNGRVVDALDLLGDALEQSRQRGDTTAIAGALNSLAQLYAEWGLAAEADIYASEAAELTMAGVVEHPVIAAEALTAKAHCAVVLEQEEVLQYLMAADSVASGLPYNMGQEDIDLIYARYVGGEEAIKRINRYVGNTEPYQAVEGWLELAKVYKGMGDYVGESQALDSLSAALAVLSNKVQVPSEVWRFALGEYANNNDRQHLEALGRLIAVDTLSLDDESAKHSLWENVLREQQATHEMQMKAMAAEKQLLLTRVWLAIVGALFIICVAVGVVLWLRKLYRRRQAELYGQLTSAMNQVEEERRRAESMIVEPDSLGVIRQLTPSLLIEKGEMEFREQFIRLYPHFLTSLPELSHRDELLCMLIALDVDAHRCAHLLNITKASVNTARYRLRRKLDLPQDASLDDYIRSHLS